VLNLADFDAAGGEREYRRALEMAPGDGTVKSRLGVLLAARGRLQEAAAMLHESLDADPFLTIGYIQYARVLVGLDRLDEAVASIHKAMEQQPGASRLHAVLTEIAIMRGNAAEALSEAKAEPEGFWREFAVTLALQKQNDAAAADAALREFAAKHAENGAFQVAVVYALRKERDQVFTWLSHAFEVRDVGLYLMYSDPFLRQYRDDPRFATLHSKMDPQPAAP
jgi:tetratricopeptide (TPR) repeat protein